MSGYLLVPGPSRGNDRTFTWAALHHARAACGGEDLLEAVSRVALALDGVLGLHPGAKQWPGWQQADRAWWSLSAAVTSMQPRSMQGRLLAQALAGLDALAAALGQADGDEVAVAVLEQSMGAT